MFNRKGLLSFISTCNVEKLQKQDFKTLKFSGDYDISVMIFDNLLMFRQKYGGAFTFELSKLKYLLDKVEFSYRELQDITVSWNRNIQRNYVDKKLLILNWLKVTSEKNISPSDYVFLDRLICKLFKKQNKEDPNKVYDFLFNYLQYLPYEKLSIVEISTVARYLVKESIPYSKDFQFVCGFLKIIYDDYLKDNL